MVDNFEEIITELRRIKQARPEMNITQVIQEAADNHAGRQNANLHQLNEKNILTALRAKRTKPNKVVKHQRIRGGV